MAQVPECPQHLQGICPKSQTKLMGTHGTVQSTWYWTFCCVTCKYLFIEWNPAVVAAAKRNELDREIGNLISPRFRGLS